METYPPLNSLKRVDDDIWIVDGPLIRFGPPGLKMPFPTRMTVVRIGADLFIHSPTPLSPALRAEIEAIGRPAWIVGPSTIHYWWVPEWKAAFADAEVYLAPGAAERGGDRLRIDHQKLDRVDGYPWDAQIATLPVSSRTMTEVVFFHRPSATLILTDFIENFEAGKIGSPLTRILARLGGVLAPHGQMARDMRLTFLGRRDGLRRAVEQMIAWNPRRIIVAHGRWFQENGRAELKRAFGWLLR